ncbi:MAG: nucleoside diphosphate kinase regulator [Thermoanaerobaculia bacterium]|jgi:regulator of nucleoside diphosphate kinase
MFDGKICVTERDKHRLSTLLGGIDTSGEDREHLDDLRYELERATVIVPSQVPPDVVTMHSLVRVTDLDDRRELVYAIVYPHEANYANGKISIVAPLGTALLGYRAGDTIEWQVPGGRRRLRIEEIVYQPEAEGDYEL